MRRIKNKIFNVGVAIALVCALMIVNTFSLMASEGTEKKLEDGSYNIEGNLLKANSDDLSMADKALLGVTAVVEGESTKIVLEMGSISGVYLENFEYDDGTGNYTEAEITSYDEDGNITGFAFPIQQNVQITNVKFTFSMGIVMTQEARLSLNWSLDEGETETETEEETTTTGEPELPKTYELAEGIYHVAAQFWHAVNNEPSSANDTIKEVKLIVDKQGGISVELSLQSAKGLDFYDFEFEQEDGVYEAVEVIAGESSTPTVIKFTLPKNVQFTNMKTTYPNPYLGAHTVSVRLNLDLENAVKISEENTETTESNENNNIIKDGVYSIDATILNASSDDVSMGNKALESAYIVVKNDKLTLFLNMGSIQGVYLDSFEYESVTLKTITYAQAKAALKNENGDITRFSLPISYQKDTVNVRFTFNMGMVMTQPARLALDWDTFALTSQVIPEEENETTEKETTNKETTTADIETESSKNSKLDKDNLEDGIYEVELDLWHAANDQASMASGAVVKTARISVENGTYTMFLYTKEMTMGTIQAYLQQMKVEDGQGGYAQAVIKTTDTLSNPTSFAFTMPHTKEYIDVKVNPEVALMGNDYIDARLKLSWNTLEQISSKTNLTDVPEVASDDTNASVGSSVNTGDSNIMVMLSGILVISAFVLIYNAKKNKSERDCLEQ